MTLKMKKTITLLFIVCIFYSTSFAQTYYLVKGGYSSGKTKLIPDDNLQVDNVSGLNMGISFRTFFTDWFYIQPEFLYTQKGHIVTDKLTNNEIIHRSEYIQLPFLVGIYLFHESDYGIYIHTGAHVSIGVGGIIHDEIDFNIRYGFNPRTSDYDPYDLGLIAGFGAEIKRFNVEASYDLGLKEISSGNEPDIEMFTRCLNITVGYFIVK